MTNAWEFKGYTVIEEMDVLRFENLASDVIGYVSKNENQEVEALDNDETPIEDKWEDGNGNELNVTGWGYEAPRGIETMYERLHAILESDGENEKYMTLYNDENELLEEKEGFENDFNVKASELSFPVVVLDDQNSVGGHIFESDDVDDLKDKALDYFKRK